MKVKDYIENGAAMDYCLGVMPEEDKAMFERALAASQELREELEAVQTALGSYALEHQLPPPAPLKEKIWLSIQNRILEQPMKLNSLPLIDKYSDHQAWIDAVKPLLPCEVGKNIFTRILTGTPKVTQVLIMSGIDIPDEVHEDVHESFIILEGECECHIGEDQVVRLGAGDYFEIPLHTHHDVKVISDYVIGVMQRIAA